MAKVNKEIPLSIPFVTGNAKAYVNDCLDSGWVSSVGAYVDRFERTIAKDIGRKFAVACVNGTSALHTALMVSGIGPGDEVIVPALTFAAPAFAVKYCGAYPVFMDAEEQFWQMDVDKLASFLATQCTYRKGKLVNKNTKRIVKAIIPVHLLGHPCDMGAIMALARTFKLIVIEDTAESVGAKYKGKIVGGIGHFGCFSFNGNKIITCGGGGLLTTDRKAWASKAKYLTTQAKDDPVEYIHHEIGFNYRLTNMQAALGLAQWECLNDFIAAKQKLAKRYAGELCGVPGLSLPKQAPWADAYHWLYTVRIDPKKFGCDRLKAMHILTRAGIQSRPLWHPLDTLKPFKSCFSYHVHTAYQLYAQALSLPSSVALKASDQARVIDRIKRMA